MTDLVYVLDRVEAQALTEDIRNHASAVWSLLIRAHQGKAWKALGYSTWVEYVGAEFDIGKSRSYQILDQARVVQAIEAETSTSVDISEAEARDFKRDLPAVIEAAKQAVANLPEGTPEQDKREAVKAAIQTARPVVRINTKTTEEVTETFDARTGEQIDSVFDKAREALDAGVVPEAQRPGLERMVAADDSYKNSQYITAFVKSLSFEFTRFDAERIAAIADDDVVRTVEHLAQSASGFYEKVRRARSGLRLIEGGQK